MGERPLNWWRRSARSLGMTIMAVLLYAGAISIVWLLMFWGDMAGQ